MDFHGNSALYGSRTGPATDEPYCPAGLPGRHKWQPDCPAGQYGRATRLVCRRLYCDTGQSGTMQSRRCRYRFFAGTPQHWLTMLFGGLNNPQIVFPLVESGPQSTRWFHGPTRANPSIGISIGSAVFAGHIHVTNTQTDTHTDRPRYVWHIWRNRPHLCNAMQATRLKTRL